MSQIMKVLMVGLLFVIGPSFLGGCGSSTPNSQAVVNGEGQHAANWLPAGHMLAAREDQAVCTECPGLIILAASRGYPAPVATSAG